MQSLMTLMDMRGRCIFSVTKEQPARWLLRQRSVYSEALASLVLRACSITSGAVQALIIVLICSDTLEVKVPILPGQRSPTPPPVSSLLSLCFLRQWPILYRIRF